MLLEPHGDARRDGRRHPSKDIVETGQTGTVSCFGLMGHTEHSADKVHAEQK